MRLTLIRRVTICGCAATFAVGWSCTKETASPASPRESVSLGILAGTPESTPLFAKRDVDPACTSLDASPIPALQPPLPDQRTQLALVERLERQAAAGDGDTPALLLELGRAKSVFRPEARYAESHGRDFFHDEPSGDALYRGTDFKELLRRFPDHELADDAAYELTRLPLGGDCEGFIACYVAREWEPLSTFLLAYPNSPLADAAVDRALSAFENIEADKDLRTETDFYEPKAIGELVASLDAVGRTLTQPRRARLLLRAGILWESFADSGKAMSAYRAGLDGAESAAQRCFEAQLRRATERTVRLDR